MHPTCLIKGSPFSSWFDFNFAHVKKFKFSGSFRALLNGSLTFFISGVNDEDVGGYFEAPGTTMQHRHFTNWPQTLWMCVSALPCVLSVPERIKRENLTQRLHMCMCVITRMTERCVTWAEINREWPKRQAVQFHWRQYETHCCIFVS